MAVAVISSGLVLLPATGASAAPPTASSTKADGPALLQGMDGSIQTTPPSFSGFSAPGDIVRVEVDGSPACTGTVSANGQWGCVGKAVLPGSHTATAIAPSGRTDSQQWTASDSERRPVFITGITDAETSQPTFVGTATPGARVRVSAGSVNVTAEAAVADADGNWRLTASRATDLDGKVVVATQLASDFASLSDSFTYSALDTPLVDPRVGLAAAVLVVLGGAVGWSVRRRRGVVAVG